LSPVHRRCESGRAFYIIVIIGYAGSGRAAGLVPSGLNLVEDQTRAGMNVQFNVGLC